MGITHVIRGDDHLNNTPKQIHLFAALGASTPVFAHVPMIFGADGAKLSKRHGAVSVLQYEEEGYLPDALLNYLVRLGWSHGDQEIFTRDEMIRLFDISDVNKAASAFNPEKLLWLNQQHLMRAEPSDVVPYLRRQLERLGIPADTLSDESFLQRLILAQRERSKTLKEMAENSRCFFGEFAEMDAAATAKHLTTESKAVLAVFKQTLESLTDWTAASLHVALKTISDAQGLGLGKVAQPLRVAVTGRTVSPPMDLTLELLGREKTLMRLKRAIS
jgi:glutamyl-tRNA synthetase